MLFSLPLSSCRQEAQPAGQGEPSAEPSGKADGMSDKVIGITMGFTIPETTTVAKALLAWADEVETRSEGRVKFTHYFSWSLIPSQNPDEIPRAVSSGIADIHNFVGRPGMMPLNYNLLTLPFLGWPSIDAANEIVEQLYVTFPELEAEIEALGVEFYCMVPTGPQHIQTMKKEIRHPDDMKGLRYIADGVEGELVKALGGTPVQVPAGDYYTSLERGVADGILNATGACVAFGLVPLGDYFHEFGDGGISFMLQGVIINPDFWNSLPADIQQIFIDTRPSLVQGLVQSQHAANNAGLGIAKKENQTIVKLTPEELKVWQDASSPLRESIVQGLADDGYPIARDIYKEMLRLIDANN